MFIGTTEPKARKQHRCYLCGRLIEKGEKHRKHVGTYDGDFYSMRNHFDCDKHTDGWATEDWEYHEPQIFIEEYLGD